MQLRFTTYCLMQLYDTGACVYFYFGFLFKGLKNPIHVFSEVEEEARDEILKHGTRCGAVWVMDVKY